MLSLFLIVALGGEPTDATAEVLAAYRIEAAKAGRDAQSQIDLARWCEARGLRAEMETHLARAVMFDPSHREARDRIGLPPASHGEYVGRRDRTPETAEGRWDLALWCESVGLKDEAHLHLMQVVLLDPQRDAAWKRLGYRKKDGRWLTDDQIAEGKREAEAQQKADRSWKSLLEKWKGLLARADRIRDKDARADRIAEVERLFAAVADSRAVPSIVRVFGSGGMVDEARAAQLLGQIDSHPATRALAVLSFQSPSADVRRQASESLRTRDPVDYVELLAALLRDEIRYEFRADGNGGARLVVEGDQAVRVRRYGSTSPMDLPGLMAGVVQPGPEIGFVLDSRTSRPSLPSNAIPVGTMPDGTPAYIVDDTGVTIRASHPGGAYNVNPIPAAFGGLPASGNITEIKTSRVDSSATTALASPAVPVSNPGVLNGLPKPLAAAAAALVPSFEQFEAMQLNQLQQQMQWQWMVEESQKIAMASHQQQMEDVATIERANARTRESNDRIVMTLTTATGQDFGPDRRAWARWSAERRGSRLVEAARTPKLMFFEDAPVPYRPRTGPPLVYRAEAPQVPFCVIFTHHLSTQKTPTFSGGGRWAQSNTGGETWFSTPTSCFAPGTPVATPNGPRPIEGLREGDAVYVRNPDGGTGVAPVLTLHQGAFGPTLRLTFASGEIAASPSHPIARAAGGWTRADALVSGQLVDSRGGPVPVLGVADGEVTPLYNLEVSGGNTYFVGAVGVLVHDASPIEPAAIEARRDDR